MSQIGHIYDGKYHRLMEISITDCSCLAPTSNTNHQDYKYRELFQPYEAWGLTESFKQHVECRQQT